MTIGAYKQDKHLGLRLHTMYAKKGSNSSAVDANAPTLKTPVANRENASKDSIREAEQKSQENSSEQHKDDDGRHKEAVFGWDYYRTVFAVNGKFYEGIIKIMCRQNGREFIDVTKIREIPHNADLSSDKKTLQEPADVGISNVSIRQTSEKSQEKVSASDREYLELAEDPENNEAAAIITAPYVLKRGFAISSHKNHKYKGYPSVTFAGKVEINGAEGIVGVCSICG